MPFYLFLPSNSACSGRLDAAAAVGQGFLGSLCSCVASLCNPVGSQRSTPWPLDLQPSELLPVPQHDTELQSRI